jgi:hypothetical protein
MHSVITASLVGCDAKAKDAVLVNGSPPDGITWDLLKIVPPRDAQLTPADRDLGKRLSQAMGLGQVPPVASEVVLRLKPGYYNFALKVGQCVFGSIPLVAANFYGARHVTLVSDQIAPQSDVNNGPGHTGGIFGSIPSFDEQVTLQGTNGYYLARNEDNSDLLGAHYMYFFDAVPPGTYDLIVNGFGWAKNLGKIVVDDTNQAMYREIKFSDVFALRS